MEQPNSNRTPGRVKESSGLDRVRQAAKRNEQMKFTALLHHINIELLRSSYYNLKRKAAPGVDGVVWRNMEKGWRNDSSICTAGFIAEHTEPNRH